MSRTVREGSLFLTVSYSAWTRGFCIGSTGNNCPKRHFYLDGERAHDPTNFNKNHQVSGQEVEFSSPLVVKVRKEVAKERMEEVDLDTGHRRSWVVEKEFDIYDLTGLS